MVARSACGGQRSTHPKLAGYAGESEVRATWPTGARTLRQASRIFSIFASERPLISSRSWQTQENERDAATSPRSLHLARRLQHGADGAEADLLELSNVRSVHTELLECARARDGGHRWKEEDVPLASDPSPPCPCDSPLGPFPWWQVFFDPISRHVPGPCR